MTYDAKEILSMFDGFYFSPDFSEDDNNMVDQFLTDNDLPYLIYHGSSKLVLVPEDDDKDYVIKIPYCGMYVGHDTDFTPFVCAPAKERKWDYCEAEVERFSIAKEHNLDFSLAETRLIGFVHNHPIYIQERCVSMQDENDSSTSFSPKELIKTRNLIEDSGRRIPYQMSLTWLADFELWYGTNTLMKFIDFLVDNEWDDDLRTANIGYNENNRPVLIDYSSFYE